MERPHTALNTIPKRSGRRRSALRTNQVIDSRLQLSELTLNEAALSESSTEEGGVDSDQDPRARLESDSREEETTPEKDLEDSNETHRRIIVFLDELADHISVWVGLGGWLGTRAGTSSGSNWLRGLDGGNEVCAGVGRDVEDGVDAEGEHGEGVLGSEKPDEGHGQVLDILISSKSKRA